MLQLIIYGLIVGSIFVLGGVGLTLTYSIMNFANFAHGDIMTLGGYIALLMVATVLPALGMEGHRFGSLSFGYPMIIAMVVAMIIAILAALLSDRIIYRPLRRKGSVSIIIAISSFGVAIILRHIIMIIWGSRPQLFFRGIRLPIQALLPYNIRINADQIFIICTALFLVTILHFFLKYSKMGKAMRAASDNLNLAMISGIDTEKVIVWTWAIGSAMAAVAGILLGINVMMRPEIGWLQLLPIFAAVILGGIGNPYGAMAGGFIIGISQEVSTAFLPPAYKTGVSFVILILVLLFRPYGIFGKGGK